MTELLSICIPTYGRDHYLAHLLASLQAELFGSDLASYVKIYISDNASPDSTPKVVHAFSKTLPIDYKRNPENIGGDWNIYEVAGRAAGRYFWLIGDDEYVVAGSLRRLIEFLKSSEHGLIVLREVDESGTGGYEFRISRPASYTNYREYVHAVKTVDPWLLMHHSLISICIIRRDSVDRVKYREMLGGMDIHYSHMYALVSGVNATEASVYIGDFPVICVRKRRAAVGVKLFLLKKLWMRHYIWLAGLFGAPELIVYGKSQYNLKQKIRAKKHWIKIAFSKLFQRGKGNNNK